MNQNSSAVDIQDVTMVFNLNKENIDSLKEYFIKFIKKQLFFNEFIAVDNISLNIKKGEIMGFIGLNGSGKSTLLKIIAGVYKPTKGSISVNGNIAPLIELGSGFDFELTARENIYLNGAVLGYSKKFIDNVFNDIVDFTELHEFLDVPIKNYSSGMVARVGFAIATLVKPDILIADEILSVGDFLFQQKCEKRIRQLMADGTTVILVSHDITQIERLCDRVAWLEKGKLKMLGSTKEICDIYKNHHPQ
ncbi:MAG: ABC transporter ATP-binding protein [Oscillospiraceae bacterium]